MANALNIATVAEGVEAKEQYALVRGLGVRYIQGFLFSPALPPQEAMKFAKKFRLDRYIG